MSQGAPIKYDPSYCAMLEQHMENGLSFESFAGVVGVCKKTLYNWVDNFPEFSEAKDKAFEKNRLYWERQGLAGLWTDQEGPNFNSTVWIYNMKNRFPQEWRDRNQVALTGKDDGPVELEATFKVTDETIEKLVLIARGAKNENNKA